MLVKPELMVIACCLMICEADANVGGVTRVLKGIVD